MVRPPHEMSRWCYAGRPSRRVRVFARRPFNTSEHRAKLSDTGWGTRTIIQPVRRDAGAAGGDSTRAAVVGGQDRLTLAGATERVSSCGSASQRAAARLITNPSAHHRPKQSKRDVTLPGAGRSGRSPARRCALIRRDPCARPRRRPGPTLTPMSGCSSRRLQAGLSRCHQCLIRLSVRAEPCRLRRLPEVGVTPRIATVAWLSFRHGEVGRVDIKPA
jgi:hypothetical protein